MKKKLMLILSLVFVLPFFSGFGQAYDITAHLCEHQRDCCAVEEKISSRATIEDDFEDDTVLSSVKGTSDCAKTIVN